ncbi:MAG: terminase TerL endonuclease subunit [Alphaproteobacteria bacterium]
MTRRKPLADRALAFMRRLRVPRGDLSGKLYRPLALFETAVHELFDEGSPVREAVISLPRKTGKSSFAAALVVAALLGPLARKNGAIVVAASSKDQARLVWQQAWAMIEANPSMLAKIKSKSQHYGHIISKAGSQVTVLPANEERLQGQFPDLAIIDELASHPNLNLYQAIKTALSGSHSRVLVISTRSGFRHRTPLDEVLEAAEAAGHESTSVTLLGLQDGQDWQDEAVWHAVNPAIEAGYVSIEHYRAEFAKAKVNEAIRQTFLALLLNGKLVIADDMLIEIDHWDGCARPGASIEAGGDVHLGIDLGENRDTSAIALYRPADGLVHAWTFIPRESAEGVYQDRRIPAMAWAEAGHLIATPGHCRDDHAMIAKLREIADEYRIVSIRADRWHLADITKRLGDYGLDRLADLIEPHGQGFKDMSPAIEKFETAVIERRVWHVGSPVLRWNVFNARVQRDAAGNRKPTKEKVADRIDTLVSVIMAISAASDEIESGSYIEHSPLLVMG